MIKVSTTYHFSPVPQEPQVRPPTGQDRSLQMNIPVRKLEIDLDRAQEVIEQAEKREQAIISRKRRSAAPVAEQIRETSIEIDSLMAKYQAIGCSPRANFPDTFSLTILERYYQPMTGALKSDTINHASDADSLQLAAPVAIVNITPPPVTGLVSAMRPEGYPSAVTLFLMCALSLLAGIKFHFGENLRQAIKSFFNYQQARRMLVERRESDKQATLYSNILFSFVAGIFISLVLPFFGISLPWDSYGLSIVSFSLAVGLLYMVKAGIWKTLGVVFVVQPFSREYVYSMFLYNCNLSLFIFPFVAAIPFVSGEVLPYLIFGAATILGIAYLLRIWRIFQIIHAQNAPVYYFILYLCTLEILPLLLFVKVCKVLNDCLVM